MRSICAFALIGSLVVISGCCSTGTDCASGWANNMGGGGCETGCGPMMGGGNFGGNFFARQGGGCETGDCGASANLSDYSFDCGPMCGAAISNEQYSSPIECSDCQVGPSAMPGYLRGKAGALRGRVGGALCKGLGAMVGCGGCRDCGGSAIGQNNSAIAGPSKCTGCLRGGRCLGGRCSGRSIHPFGGQLPHTANAAGGGATGFGGGGSAPSYAYPYYTTRGPRDFLQDGCGPPPIYPVSYTHLTLPTKA